jgi:hypothetical protein
MKKNMLIIFMAISYTAIAQTEESDMQFWRPYDQRGINIFEPGKEDTVAFEKLKVRLGGNFTQQFQFLEHSNTASPVFNADGININQLIEIGPGFNLATANLNLDVQLADGVRMNLITYLSSKHHPETWVKGGFVQIDKMPFLNSSVVDNIMQYISFRVGHMEINYGDAHFRRTDNGNAFYNPFVGNYIMDAFTTEIGGEVYYFHNGIIAMAAITGGEIQGSIIKTQQRAPSFYGKIGFDNNISENLRVRITGSAYHTERSISNSLYYGDRAGSRYYLVMENTLASPAANFTSGRWNPAFRDKVTAVVINPFIKFRKIELFGNLEQAMGRSHQETEDRTWTQLGADLVFRFGKTENFYVAGRYNTVYGEQTGTGANIGIDRYQAGLGWFVTKNILAKAEYVKQNYYGFRNTSILNGGQFNGVMLEGAIAF